MHDWPAEEFLLKHAIPDVSVCQIDVGLDVAHAILTRVDERAQEVEESFRDLGPIEVVAVGCLWDVQVDVPFRNVVDCVAGGAEDFRAEPRRGFVPVVTQHWMTFQGEGLWQGSVFNLLLTAEHSV